MRSIRTLIPALALLAAVATAPCWAVHPRAHAVDPANAVDMFQAVQQGDIDVRLIAQNAKGGNVLIENKTDQPVTVKLPDAFAGVLAQFGGGGFGGGGLGGGGLGGGGLGGGGLGGGNQGLGGGFGGGGGLGGGGFGGGGLGGGFFNVAPGKVGKIKVTTVCLEHGKPEPNPRIPYKLVPIESFSDKPEVAELCRLVGSGQVDQSSAQAAAWHLANGLSWPELAHKIGRKHLNGATEPYFTPQQLMFAQRIAGEALRRAESRQTASPAESLSPGESTTK